MKEYIKIETLYKRDVKGTRKLIEGDFQNETVKFLKDNPWVFTEKIDGTNTGVHWDGHKVEFFGRTEATEIPKALMAYLNKMFGTMEAEELFEQKFGSKDVILYGEGYGNKIQKAGKAYRSEESFILFDVLIESENGPIWMKREAVEDIATTFGIDVVPIIFTGTLQEAVDFVKSKPKSTIGTADMEGVVGRPMVEVRDRLGKRVIVKVKVRDFV